jgi:outer membrane lipoprotein SlyB
MKQKLLLTGTLLAAFIGGAIFQGFTRFGTTKAATDEQTLVAAPAQRTAYRAMAPRVVERGVVYQERPVVRRHRSWQKEALIIGGSTGAGAAIGAVAGGGKGAAIGAVSGAVAGTVYDVATRNK